MNTLTAHPHWHTVMASVLAATLTGACGNITPPEYLGVDTPPKATWSRPAQFSPAETIAPDWWRGFGDPDLNALVDTAITGSFDLKALAARIGVAETTIDQARAGARPSMDIGAAASFQKVTGQPFSRQYNLGTEVNWELDIWGRVEKSAQAQEAEFRATEADWRAGYLTLVADVSTTYFQILQLDEQLAQQRVTLDKNQQILATYTSMYANGLVPETEVLRQRAEIARLTNELVELQRARDLAGNALATLLGKAAGTFTVPTGALQDRVKLPKVPDSLPAEVLKRRPDVVAAEYRVLEGYDLVGEARLAQLPSISLTAQGGTASFALTDLLKSFTLGFLPSINIPAFNPAIKARIKTTEAQIKVVEAEYQRTVIAAFEEVENALVNLEAHKKQREQLLQQVEHLSVVAAQTDAQLKEGLISQLELFETERSLLSARLALLANHQQILSDTVTLYKALGGGWPVVEVRNESK